jgi:hypothetical protein
VVERTPPHLLAEVVLVDDCSDWRKKSMVLFELAKELF